MTVSRVIWMLVVVVGCKSDKPVSGSGSGSGSASGAAADPAGSAAAVTPDAASAIDASVAAAEPTPDVVCSGRWVATLERSDTCKDDVGGPYRELDLVVAVTPTGWSTTVTKPAGFTVKHTRVGWSVKDKQCDLDIELHDGKLSRFDIELRKRTDTSSVRTRIQRASGDCISEGTTAKAAVTPDRGGLPPVAPEIAGVAGTYEVDIAWPKVACAVVPAGKQTFTIAVDRNEGDVLQATGTELPLEEVRYNGKSNVYLRTSKELAEDGDDLVEQLLLLDVSGDQVTGKAKFSTATPDPEDPPPCKAVEAKVIGKLVKR